MNLEGSTLCCCEYIDINQERSHILACCCNCQDLDESFESFVTGKNISSTNIEGFMATIHDRSRIPWHGGARQVSADVLLPIIIVPAMLLLATISVWWSVAVFSSMLLLLSYLYYYRARSLQKTKFFLSWALTSFVTLSLIFEFIVVPMLEILIHENVLLTVILSAGVGCAYVVKQRSIQMRYLMENQIEDGEISIARSYYCTICQATIPEKDHHCVWFDCCIGFHNRFLFVLAVLLSLIGLLYSSNLTLTSVCHPFRVYKTILLPDDCSDVYEEFELALSFVSAIYSIGIANVLAVFLLYEVVLISVGLTGHEWRSLPFSAKLCCAVTVRRPHNRGFCSNWYRISSRKHHKLVYQY